MCVCVCVCVSLWSLIMKWNFHLRKNCLPILLPLSGELACLFLEFHYSDTNMSDISFI